MINKTPSIFVFFIALNDQIVAGWCMSRLFRICRFAQKTAAEVKPSNRRTIKIRLLTKGRAERKLKNSFDSFVFMLLG